MKVIKLKPVRSFCLIVDKINEIIAKSAAWLIIPLIITIGYEVVARYIFNSPTIWSYEMTYFISSLLIMMSMAYTFKIKGHVGIDILINKFPVRVQAFLFVLFSLVFFFPMWFLILKVMIPNVIFAFNSNEKSWVGSWLPVIWPFKAWIVTGLVMLFLQGVVEVIRNIEIIRTGREEQ